MKGGSPLSVLLCAVAVSGTALAQTDAAVRAGGLEGPKNDAEARAATGPVGSAEEILVTSSRLREESLQETPVAVSVLTPAVIDNLHTVNITALSSVVPNLTVQETAVAPGVPAISLRGFNTRTSDPATEPGVAVYVDGVYQTTINGSMVDLYDLDRIEVLRGPQGTLLGKNAGAGAILLTRSRPTGEFDFKGEVEYGRYDFVQGRGLFNFPIIQEKLAGKIFASYRRRDSWEENVSPGAKNLGGEKLASVRGAVMFTPTDTIDVYLSADYIRDRSEQRGGRNVSSPPALACNAAVVGPELVPSLCGPHTGQRGITGNGYTKSPESDDNNVALNANWNLGPVKLTSITGYRDYEQTIEADLDHTALPILHAFDNFIGVEQVSQELRISSVEGGGADLDGRLNWLIAGYWGESDARSWQGLVAFGGESQQSERVERDSKAVFGHADYKLTDLWTISFGARHSWDDTKHGFSLRQPGRVIPALDNFQRADFQNTSIEAGMQYQITPDHMVYFRYAEGYRGGGFVGLPASLEAASEFGPEESKSYEVGLKSTWWDERLMFNITVFNVDFQGMQRDITQSGPNNTFVQVTTNAANATTRGVEIETVLRPLDGLTLRGNFGYLDAKYTSFRSIDPTSGQVIDLGNQPLTYAPEYTASLSADYGMPINPTLGFDLVNFFVSYDWRSELTESNTNHASGFQGDYGVATAAIALEAGERYRLTFYGDNLFDKRYIVLGDDVGGLVAHAYDNIGRTYGLKLAVQF